MVSCRFSRENQSREMHPIQSGLAEAKESRCKEIADELVKQVTAIGCDENNAHIGRRGEKHAEKPLRMVIVWLIYGYYMVNIWLF